MTVQRWAATSAVMAAIGFGLWAAAPDPGSVTAAVGDPQRWVDTQGPDALLVLLAWSLAVACWSWGALGLLLTVAGTGSGVGGHVARALLTVVLPAGLRQAAALAVGVSLVAAPVAVAGVHGPAAALVSTAAQDSSAAGRATGTADWSDVGATPATGPALPVPDWPAPVTSGEHVVVRGDCLWDIAAAWLAPHGPASVAQVEAAVQAWWQANAEVIGPDPDLLLPGQVLHAPVAP